MLPELERRGWLGLFLCEEFAEQAVHQVGFAQGVAGAVVAQRRGQLFVEFEWLGHGVWLQWSMGD